MEKPSRHSRSGSSLDSRSRKLVGRRRWDPLRKHEEEKKLDWEEEAPSLIDDELKIENPILANLFHYLMIGLGLAIVFAICGGLLFLFLSFKGPEFTRAETPLAAWGQFGVGGSLGVAALLMTYFNREKPRGF